MVAALRVSTEIGTPAPASARITGRMRACSISGGTGAAARPRALAADVERCRPRPPPSPRPAAIGRARIGVRAAVAETVRRDVEDAHDGGAADGRARPRPAACASAGPAPARQSAGITPGPAPGGPLRAVLDQPRQRERERAAGQRQGQPGRDGVAGGAAVQQARAVRSAAWTTGALPLDPAKGGPMDPCSAGLRRRSQAAGRRGRRRAARTSGTEARRLSGAGSSTTFLITGSPRSTVRISSPDSVSCSSRPARQPVQLLDVLGQDVPRLAVGGVDDAP